GREGEAGHDQRGSRGEVGRLRGLGGAGLRRAEGGPSARVSESLREPRVYKGDEPEERRTAAGELAGSFKGRRWAGFQEGLRLRRKKIVVDCPRCGSQERVA